MRFSVGPARRALWALGRPCPSSVPCARRCPEEEKGRREAACGLAEATLTLPGPTRATNKSQNNRPIALIPSIYRDAMGTGRKRGKWTGPPHAHVRQLGTWGDMSCKGSLEESGFPPHAGPCSPGHQGQEQGPREHLPVNISRAGQQPPGRGWSQAPLEGPVHKISLTATYPGPWLRKGGEEWTGIPQGQTR